jgi:hypothetical protein
VLPCAVLPCAVLPLWYIKIGVGFVFLLLVKEGSLLLVLEKIRSVLPDMDDVILLLVKFIDFKKFANPDFLVLFLGAEVIGVLGC